MRGAVLAAAVMVAAPASAELTLSQMVVELNLSTQKSANIEIHNDSAEPAYLLVEPSEVKQPGTPSEKRVPVVDPREGGLLVSPARAVLSAGERKSLRVSVIGGQGNAERVYRILVRPVAGEVTGSQSGLKVLVGYDVLVLVRPSEPTIAVKSERQGDMLTLTNTGNVSVELADGKLCRDAKLACTPLPSKRLYLGATWRQKLPATGSVEYRLHSAGGSKVAKF